MSDIEQRARDAAVKAGGTYVAALRAEIEAHDATKAEFEAFRREVSEAVKDTKFMVETHCETEALTLLSNRLNRFILPDPVDPLAEALDTMLRRRTFEPAAEVVADEAAWLRAFLAERGLTIKEQNP